jgi:hypothetical protein
MRKLAFSFEVATLSRNLLIGEIGKIEQVLRKEVNRKLRHIPALAFSNSSNIVWSNRKVVRV